MDIEKIKEEYYKLAKEIGLREETVSGFDEQGAIWNFFFPYLEQARRSGMAEAIETCRTAVIHSFIGMNVYEEKERLITKLSRYRDSLDADRCTHNLYTVEKDGKRLCSKCGEWVDAYREGGDNQKQ